MSKTPPQARAGKPGVSSIRLIVSATAALLVALSVGGAGFMFERQARQALTQEIESRLLLEARHLALTSSRALLSDFPELTLEPVVREMLSGDRGIVDVVVLDHVGAIAAHPDARLLGHRYSPPAGLGDLRAAVTLQKGESLRGDRKLLVASAPVLGASGGVIGTAIVQLRRDVADRALASARTQQLALLALFVLGGVVASWILVSQLLRPIGGLRLGIERIGAGKLDERIPVEDRTELGMLAGAINDMAVALQHAQDEMLERERLSHEIELARDIQRSLLPKQAFRSGAVEVMGDQRAAAEVGGDYWDVFDLNDGRVGVVIADVAGKGLAGCLVMSMLSALLRAYRALYTSPAAVLGAVHDRLCESLQPGMFVTVFYGAMNPATGELVYCSAGHNAALLWRANERGIERLTPRRGAPLASIRDARLKGTLIDSKVVLEPGDMLVQYTDGFTESFQPKTREAFGDARLEETLGQLAGQGASAVLAGLPRAVLAWREDGPADDDETLIVISRAATPLAPVPGQQVAVLDRLAKAEATEKGLRMHATMPAVGTVRDWVLSLPAVRDLEEGDRELLVTGLYEVCANIIEHGYHDRTPGGLELWWLPPEDARQPSVPESLPSREAKAIVRRGEFIVRDDGAPFQSSQWSASDFTDPAVRTRGRGFGLDIVHRMMREVACHPGTPRGNITVIIFDPPQGRRSPAQGAVS